MAVMQMSERTLLDAARRRMHVTAEALSYKVRYGDGPYVYFSDKPRCKVLVGNGSYSGIIEIVSNRGQELKIGKYTSIGHHLNIIMAAGHNAGLVSTYPLRERFSERLPHDQSFGLGDIRIGNDCWIGDDVTLVGGCTIGDGVVIGTKSLVTSKQKLEDFGVYGGVPARLLRFRFDKKTITALKRLRWWDLPKPVIASNIELFYNPNAKYVIERLSKLRKASRDR